MSLPVTEEEHEQAERTMLAAGHTENLLSTACPKCTVRFAMLARGFTFGTGPLNWSLRCVSCGHRVSGELK